MLKPKFLNILFFLFVKHIAFFILLALFDDRFKALVLEGSRNTRELISNTGYYSLYILFYTLLATVFFCIPLYLTFKVRYPILFTLLLSVILIAEYVFYTYMASTTDLMNGVYNGLISILFLFIFFYRHFVLIFRKRAN